MNLNILCCWSLFLADKRLIGIAGLVNSELEFFYICSDVAISIEVFFYYCLYIHILFY